MGTTIRREPVTTSIPAAPDYRFLNITNFGGIEKSSNPFVVESNTASDCLNVYVDEDNALSTRPRLQYQTSFIKDIIAKFPALELTGAFDIIGVYDLHEGYLVHGVENSEYYMFKYISEENIRLISGADIPKTKCKVFEQTDNIYVLDGDKYRNIIGDVISEVEGYIPTTRIGKTNTTNGTTYESLNLLTTTYKESYTWDASWSVNEITTDEKSITNNYVKSLWKGLGVSNRIVKKIYKDPLDKNKLNFLTWNPNIFEWQIRTYDIDDDKWINLKLEMPTDTPSHEKTHVDCSQNGEIVAVRRWGSSDSAKDGVYVRRNGAWSKLNTINYTFSTLGDSVKSNHIKVSSDGNVIIVVTNDVYDKSDPAKILIFEYDGRGSYSRREVLYSHEKFSYDYHIITGLELSADGLLGFVLSTPSRDMPDGVREPTNINRFYIYDKDSVEITDEATTVARAINGTIKDIASDGTRLAIVVTHTIPELRLYDDVKSVSHSNVDSAYTVLIAKDFNGDVVPAVQPVFYNNVLYVTEGIFDLTDKKYTRLIFGENKIHHSGYRDSEYFYYTNDAHNARFVDSEYMCFMYEDVIFDLAEGNFRDFVHINTLHFMSEESLLIITRTLSDDSEYFENYMKLKPIMLSSQLISRFDNNTWFASKNYTFYTLYNNPKYIPYSSYNDLGEDYEHITGLCIINDNVLAAYKRNRIYIITPTANENIPYSHTETKNIVGNDVIDSPILTSLTEMPVIVSYDGIYALNQLENVQSSDRITTLISEDVNPNWLKERQEDVSRCITLNRLYWTYFILPHKKVVNGLIKDEDYTKVYLLDNRTQNWFYWELPIYIISAMIKANKTHFVTETGDVYTLETTDIINKFNKDLTEYYDVLKKPTLIPWHWTSQILSLNTINYAKRLVDTTFVLTDTDFSDEYALNYKFKAFRKNKNAETTELTLSNDIEYVESITKRTMIPRFNFLQFTLSNTEDDQKLNNNKLRLVGLGLKYVLLGGLY